MEILGRHCMTSIKKKGNFSFLKIHHCKLNMMVGVDHALFKGVGPLLSIWLCVCQGYLVLACKNIIIIIIPTKNLNKEKVSYIYNNRNGVDHGVCFSLICLHLIFQKASLSLEMKAEITFITPLSVTKSCSSSCFI